MYLYKALIISIITIINNICDKFVLLLRIKSLIKFQYLYDLYILINCYKQCAYYFYLLSVHIPPLKAFLNSMSGFVK